MPTSNTAPTPTSSSNTNSPSNPAPYSYRHLFLTHATRQLRLLYPAASSITLDRDSLTAQGGVFSVSTASSTSGSASSPPTAATATQVRRFKLLPRTYEAWYVLTAPPLAKPGEKSFGAVADAFSGMPSKPEIARIVEGILSRGEVEVQVVGKEGGGDGDGDIYWVPERDGDPALARWPEGFRC